jgi:DNA primase
MCNASSDSDGLAYGFLFPVPRVQETVMAGIDFAALRRQLRLGQVLELLGFVPGSRAAAHVRGPCPVHRSQTARSRSFFAHLQRHCWQCFRCGAHGNALDLWVAATQLPLYEAALDLCRRLRVDIPWLPEQRWVARSPPRP